MLWHATNTIELYDEFAVIDKKVNDLVVAVMLCQLDVAVESLLKCQSVGQVCQASRNHLNSRRVLLVAIITSNA